MLDLSNLFIPAILFFAIGLIAHLVHSDLKFPPDLSKILSIYLLVGIGLHGGIELANASLATALSAVGVALLLGFGLPVVAYYILFRLGRIDRLNSAAIAAHYGSVSAGTFLTAIAFLDSQQIVYEKYPVIMLAIMESPAIIVGLLLAKLSRHAEGIAEENGRSDIRHLVHEAFTNGSVMLLLGAMLVGILATPQSLLAIKPFYTDIFMGALSLFLLDMGMEAARRLHEFRRVGWFLVAFGVVMPMFGGVVGTVAGHYVLGFGIGGTMLVAVLAASASYIAVPPAMRLAIPEANPSFYLTLSLGVTFPFNVVIGIPLYYAAARYVVGN